MPDITTEMMQFGGHLYELAKTDDEVSEVMTGYVMLIQAQIDMVTSNQYGVKFNFDEVYRALKEAEEELLDRKPNDKHN